MHLSPNDSSFEEVDMSKIKRKMRANMKGTSTVAKPTTVPEDDSASPQISETDNLAEIGSSGVFVSRPIHSDRNAQFAKLDEIRSRMALNKLRNFETVTSRE